MVLSNYNILNILTVWNIKMGKNHLMPKFSAGKAIYKNYQIGKSPLKANCFFPSSFFHNRIY